MVHEEPAPEPVVVPDVQPVEPEDVPRSPKASGPASAPGVPYKPEVEPVAE